MSVFRLLKLGFLGAGRIAGGIIDTTSKLLLDLFANDFEVANEVSTFNQTVSHSASTNGTMTGSDGTIKWRPHNLLTYSEDLTTARGWAAVSGGDGVPPVAVNTSDVNPNGSTGATKLTLQRTTQNTSNYSIYRKLVTIDADTTASIWVKAFDAADVGKTLDLYQNAGAVVVSQITLTNSWQKISAQKGGVNINQYMSIALYTAGASTGQVNLLIWGAHAYRSDLGGMVDNPDRGDSYVPTTSSAVYLPRRGHHIYNGYEWVNEGMLHESEARTNLITYSNDFNESIWGKYLIAVSANVAVSPDGTTNADLVYPSSSGTANSLYRGGLPTSQKSHSYVVKAAGFSWFCILDETTSAGIAWFNLATGNKGSVAANTVSFMENLGNGWYRCSAYKTASYNQYTASGPVDGDNSITVTKNGTDGIYYYHAQVELGAMASSIIPTSGATVTRAAESLIIPAANLPWPTPNVIGSELVTNGGFDDASWWGTDASWTISGGVATVTGNDQIYSPVSWVPAAVPVLISFDVTQVDTAGTLIVVATNPSQTLVSVSATGTYTVVAYFNTTDRLRFGSGSGSSFRGSIDNVSVKEIDPLSVSIQMNGRMTYADNNDLGEVSFVNWVIGTKYIRQLLRTDSTKVGLPYIQQNDGTGLAVINASPDPYLPGVFVPFNIATRHTSVSMGAGVDGVAYPTFSGTITSLPDLSTTDLNLGYDFMGTIQNFQIWDRDIGDQGLVDETAPSLEPSLFLTFDGTTGSYTVRDWSE